MFIGLGPGLPPLWWFRSRNVSSREVSQTNCHHVFNADAAAALVVVVCYFFLCLLNGWRHCYLGMRGCFKRVLFSHSNFFLSPGRLIPGRSLSSFLLARWLEPNPFNKQLGLIQQLFLIFRLKNLNSVKHEWNK